MDLKSHETNRQPTQLAGLVKIVLLGLALAVVGNADSWALSGHHDRHTRAYFREQMPNSVRADHPAILLVAAAIRAVTKDPLEQLVMVNDVTHLLVDYDDDERVYGAVEFHATFEEMLARRRESGWLYLRDDCDGRAVFAAHLLASLGISWRLEASYWKGHAWTVANVGGIEYDLLDLRENAPETARLSYRLIGQFFTKSSRRPPPFAWRRAWRERTEKDITVGLQLGMLALDSKPGHIQERNSTDWTKRAPGVLSPIDERLLTARVAGFPYGEGLSVGALASGPAPETPIGSSVLGGGTTSSPASNQADAAGHFAPSEESRSKP